MHSASAVKLPRLAVAPKVPSTPSALEMRVDPNHRKLPSLAGSPPRTGRHSSYYSSTPVSHSPRSPPPSPSSVGTMGTFVESVSLLGVPPDIGERDAVAYDSPHHFDRVVDTEVKLRLAQAEAEELRVQVGCGSFHPLVAWCGRVSAGCGALPSAVFRVWPALFVMIGPRAASCGVRRPWGGQPQPPLAAWLTCVLFTLPPSPCARPVRPNR